MDEETLAALRQAIDDLDDRLLQLLNERARLAQRVGRHKRSHGRAFYAPSRERAIVDRLQAKNPGPFPSTAIRPVFQEVISGCLSLEKSVRVAFLGPEGTFTHQAVKRHFGTSASAVPCGTIAAVFDEAERGQVDFGVIPVENSSEGIVNHTLDSFVDSDLKICGEVMVDVDHHLLAQAGVVEADIERVYSHPQALAQCRDWLASNLPRAALVECPSTTDATHRAQSDPRGAAIAAELAARLYRLEILRSQLQDVGRNVTRFLVLGASTPEPPSAAGDFKTSLLLAAPDEAGFLYRILGPLASAGINLTKIESRPSRRQLWDYIFFIDLDGHQDFEPVAPVLAHLQNACGLFKILGSYRKADPL